VLPTPAPLGSGRRRRRRVIAGKEGCDLVGGEAVRAREGVLQAVQRGLVLAVLQLSRGQRRRAEQRLALEPLMRARQL
jgi:hypothetical protein